MKYLVYDPHGYLPLPQAFELLVEILYEHLEGQPLGLQVHFLLPADLQQRVQQKLCRGYLGQAVSVYDFPQLHMQLKVE